MGGGKDLYNDFMKKLKNEHHISFREKAMKKKQDIVITIQLMGGAPSINKKIDPSFIKVIQHEYAVKYLEQLGLSATQSNIDYVLQKVPLTSCEFKSGWNNSGWLADSVQIIPTKAKKKTFENLRDQMLE